MLNWIKNTFPGVIKASTFAIARHLATWGGGIILTWLLSHHVSSGFASRLVGDFQDALLTFAGIGLTAAGIGTSLKDVASVGGKMAVATSTSYDAGRAEGQQEGVDAQAISDTVKIAAISDAMKAADKAAPATKAAVVAALKNGTF